MVDSEAEREGPLNSRRKSADDTSRFLIRAAVSAVNLHIKVSKGKDLVSLAWVQHLYHFHHVLIFRLM